jgi:hypothetical protein
MRKTGCIFSIWGKCQYRHNPEIAVSGCKYFYISNPFSGFGNVAKIAK